MKKLFLFRIFFIYSFLFLSINSIFSQEKIIKTGDDWSYYDKKESPEKNWEFNSVLNNNWKRGSTPLGYGDSAIKTEIGYGKDSLNKTITNYFKKTFHLNDPFKYILYKLNIQKDDGIVVYLNGNEITRIDMPDGEINHSSLASGLIVMGKMENIVHTIILSPEDFVTGKNTISASVHKAKVTSIDCIFNLEIIGDSNPELLPKLLKKSSLKNMQINSKVNELVSKFEIEKKDLQIELIEQTKSNMKVYLFIVGFILISTLLIFTLFWFNSRAKEKKTIKHIQKLKEKINDKDRELMNTSLNYYNNQQYLKELKKDLEKNISLDSKSMKTSIETLINKLDFNIDYSDSWDHLKYHFNAIHSGFIEKLTKMHPTLSNTEVRHCVFMKLHLQTKEIAHILHIDPRSVQASRYRIKKKMNLIESDDLKEYLQRI